MSIEVDGKTIATTDSGFLENPDDWTESVAKAMAEAEELELNEQHWDIIR
ncbi:MAG: TusE/DsrC/DsvC family sulfur relay protein, partial [Arenicellales bacterium]